MIDLDAILSPIEGENPAGENLRYTTTYDDIQEARREDDALDQGEWETEIKTADWETVKTLSIEALTARTKDLQIAIWLMEALVKTEGFDGLKMGLTVTAELLERFWDHLYPEIEDDDLDFRIGPLEFMNEKLWVAIKQIPLTDASSGNAYSWLDWEDSKTIGSEAESVEGEKKALRDEMLAAGKPSKEQFESAVTRSSKLFFESLADNIADCREAFTRLDNLLDEKFGREAPRTAEFRQALDDCEHFVDKTLKLKRELEPDPQTDETGASDEIVEDVATGVQGEGAPIQATAAAAAASVIQGQVVVGLISDTEPHEAAVWKSAVDALHQKGLKIALDTLFSASCSVSSVRMRNRYRLLMAKLCLQANRTDLARPIAEELNTLVEELGLERWESPVWVADVLGVLYRCLIQSEGGSEDTRADEIFKKMCTIDLTKALKHRQT